MLIERVARLHYELGLTQQEIANLLGLNRIKVVRLLAEARESGIVEIVIHSDEPFFGQEESRLRELFELQTVWVAPKKSAKQRGPSPFQVLGAEAIRVVTENAHTVALGVSSAIASIVDALTPYQTSAKQFVPLVGSNGGARENSNPHELARELASKVGGHAYYLPAPLIALNREAANLAYQDPAVQRVLRLASNAEVLIAGLGGMNPGEGLLLPQLQIGERDELVSRGAVGDISARFFDKDGNQVWSKLDERIVGLYLEDLLKIPRRLVAVNDVSKSNALFTALRHDFVTDLVIDLETARSIIKKSMA